MDEFKNTNVYNREGTNLQARFPYKTETGGTGMEEKTFKTINGTGALNIVLGVIGIVAGVAGGVLLIISGAKLLSRKSKMLF